MGEDSPEDAGLIENPVRGKVSISNEGQKVLLKKPSIVNCKLLKQFPSYLKFIGQTPDEGGQGKDQVVSESRRLRSN